MTITKIPSIGDKRLFITPYKIRGDKSKRQYLKMSIHYADRPERTRADIGIDLQGMHALRDILSEQIRSLEKLTNIISADQDRPGPNMTEQNIDCSKCGRNHHPKVGCDNGALTMEEKR